MEKNTAPVDRDVNTSDGAQHGTGRGSDRALLPSRKVSRSQWPTRACRVCGPGSASRGSGVTRRAVGWDSLACAPWPRAARAVNTVRLQTLAWTLSGSLVTGQPSRSPQDPGLAFRPPGWGSEGQIYPRHGGRQALGTCWTRAGRTREDPCSEFTQDREGSKAGKPQRPASLGSAPLTQGLLVLCATHPPRARKGHFTGNRPMASKLVEKSSPFSLHHILYSKQELQEARTNACLHYCCSRRPRIMTPGIGGLMTKKESTP